MTYFLRSFKYLRPYRRLAVTMALVIVAAGLADLLVPWPLKVLVDNVLGNEAMSPLLKPLTGAAPDRVALLIGVVLAGLLVALLHNVLGVLNNYVQTTLEQRIVLDFRSDLFQHAQRLSIRKVIGCLVQTTSIIRIRGGESNTICIN